MNFADEIFLRSLHESAHAYAHWLNFDGALEEVALTDKGGYCKTKNGEVTVDHNATAHLVKRQILFNMAVAHCMGKAAMAHFNGNKPDHGWKNSRDRELALKECFELGEGDKIEAELWLRIAERRATRLCEHREHWRRINNGAHALMEHGKQTGEQIGKVFSQS